MAPKKRKAKAKRRGVQQANDVITVSETNALAREPVDCNDRRGKKHIKRLGRKKKGKRGRKAKPAVVKNIPVDDNGIDESNMTDACDNPTSSLSNGGGKPMKTDINDTANEEVTHGDPDVIPENVTRSPCIIDVTCGDNSAILFMKGLSTGSKGACVLFEQNWLTPNEFQYVSGRESAKDWKRSIKHHGKSLKILVSRGLMCLKQRRCKCCSCEGRDKEDGSVCSPTVSADQGESLDSGSSGDQSQDTVCEQKPGPQNNDDKAKDLTTDADTESEVNEAPMTDDTETDSQMAADHISIPSTMSTTENEDSDDDDDSSAAEHEAAVTLALARLDVDLNGDSCDDFKSKIDTRRVPDVDVAMCSGSTVSEDSDATDSEAGTDNTITALSLETGNLTSDDRVDDSNASVHVTSQSETDTAQSDTETAQSDTEIEADTVTSVDTEVNSPVEATLIVPFTAEDIAPIEAEVVMAIDAKITIAVETGVAVAVSANIIAPVDTKNTNIIESEVTVPETKVTTPVDTQDIASAEMVCPVDRDVITPDSQKEREFSLSSDEALPDVYVAPQIANSLTDDDVGDITTPDTSESIDPNEHTTTLVERSKGRKRGRSNWTRKRVKKRKCQSPKGMDLDKQLKLDDEVQRVAAVTGSPIDVNMNEEMTDKSGEICYDENRYETVEGMDSSDNDRNVTILAEHESSFERKQAADETMAMDYEYAVCTTDCPSELKYDVDVKNKLDTIESTNLTETIHDVETEACPVSTVSTDSKRTSSLTPATVPKHDIYSLLHSTKCHSEMKMVYNDKSVYSTEYTHSRDVDSVITKSTFDILSDTNGEQKAVITSNTNLEPVVAKPLSHHISNTECETVFTKPSPSEVSDTTCRPVVIMPHTAGTYGMSNIPSTNAPPVLSSATLSSGIQETCNQYQRDTNHSDTSYSGHDGYKSIMLKHEPVSQAPRISPNSSATETDLSFSKRGSALLENIPAPPPKHKSKKKGSRLMSIIDGLRTAPKDGIAPTPAMASTSFSDSLQSAHKSRKDNAPKQYYPTTQYQTPDNSEPETEPPTCSLPKPVNPSNASNVANPGSFAHDKKAPAVRCPVQQRPPPRVTEPELSKSSFPVQPMLPFPMLPFGMSIPPPLLASMMQTGVPLEWQLALMNRQLGPNELALLTSVMNHQSGFLSGKSESKHIMPPSVSSYRGSSSSTVNSSSKNYPTAVHSRGYPPVSGRSSSLQTGLTNGRASHPYPVASSRISSGNSSSQSSRTSGQGSQDRVHPAFGDKTSEHRSYREALSQRAMATMHRTGTDRKTESSLSWEDLRGGDTHATSSASSAKQARASDALDLTKRYAQSASHHQKQPTHHSSQSSHRPKQHGGTGQPLDLSFRK